MIRNDSNEDHCRLKSEMDFLKEVNNNLIQENKYLKSENYRLKRYIDRIKNEVKPHTTHSMNQFSAMSHSTRTFANLSMEETTELKPAIAEPHIPMQINPPKTATDIPESFDAFENKNFVLSGSKALTKQHFLFEDISLYGLSETSNYKFAQKKDRAPVLL
jgi:hypothetical protein